MAMQHKSGIATQLLKMLVPWWETRFIGDHENGGNPGVGPLPEPSVYNRDLTLDYRGCEKLNSYEQLIKFVGVSAPCIHFTYIYYTYTYTHRHMCSIA